MSKWRRRERRRSTSERREKTEKEREREKEKSLVQGTKARLATRILGELTHICAVIA